MGNKRGPQHIDHIQPPLFYKGGMLGRALVRSVNLHARMPLSKGRNHIAKNPLAIEERVPIHTRPVSPRAAWPMVLIASSISSAGDAPAKETPIISVRRTPMGCCSEARAVWASLWAWHVGDYRIDWRIGLVHRRSSRSPPNNAVASIAGIILTVQERVPKYLRLVSAKRNSQITMRCSIRP